eukprot:s523_g36.t1
MDLRGTWEVTQICASLSKIEIWADQRQSVGTSAEVCLKILEDLEARKHDVFLMDSKGHAHLEVWGLVIGPHPLMTPGRSEGVMGMAP